MPTYDLYHGPGLKGWSGPRTTNEYAESDRYPYFGWWGPANTYSGRAWIAPLMSASPGAGYLGVASYPAHTAYDPSSAANNYLETYQPTSTAQWDNIFRLAADEQPVTVTNAFGSSGGYYFLLDDDDSVANETVRVWKVHLCSINSSNAVDASYPVAQATSADGYKEGATVTGGGTTTIPAENRSAFRGQRLWFWTDISQNPYADRDVRMFGFGTVRLVTEYAAYTVTLRQSTGGIIAADDASSFNLSRGGTKSVAFIPANGYHLSSVACTGGTLTNSSGNNYTFTMPTPAAAVEISATWTKTVYTITNRGASIPTAGTVTVSKTSGTIGDTFTVTYTPSDSGYSFNGWNISGYGVTVADSSKTTTTVTVGYGGITVQALVRTNSYNVAVSVTPDGAGTVTSPANNSSHVYGELVTLSQTTNTGYGFSEWLINGVSNTESSFFMPAGDTTVQAVYVANQHSFVKKVSPASSGTITTSPAGNTMPYGTSISINAAPANADYQFNEWRLSNGTLDQSSSTVSNSFTMPAGDVELCARFTKYALSWRNASLSFVQRDYELVVTKGGTCTANFGAYPISYALYRDGGGYVVKVADFTGDTATVTLRDSDLGVSYTYRLIALSTAATQTTSLGTTASFTAQPVHRTVKYYDGTEWIECIPYYYDGNNWIEVIPYRYSGSAWEECSHT